MNDIHGATTGSLSPPAKPSLAQIRPLLFALGALVIGFAIPLFHLATFALNSNLFSYILLVPFVSVWLAWNQRHGTPFPSRPNRRLAVALLGGGGIATVASIMALSKDWTLDRADALAGTTLAFVLLFAGVCTWLLGRSTIAKYRFSLCFLFFMVPMPGFMLETIESLLQHASAEAAYLMFSAVGTPLYREGTYFMLPGINMEVAPQCSGIRSSIVLLITGFVAGHMFLRSTWRQAALVLFVFPLAVLRNGFRVFTIGQLCVYVDPDMIHSAIHRRGGPLFFVLSLVPFLLLLFCLWKSERRTAPR